MERRYYIETLGCQMNKLDSELVQGTLEKKGFLSCIKPEDADVAVLNTCSVRDHAEQKAISRLGYFDFLRKRKGKPSIIVMMGCFAQRVGEEFKRAAPFIDVVCGPNQLHELDGLIEKSLDEKKIRKKVESQIAVEDFRSIRSGLRETSEELEGLDLYRKVDEGQFQQFVRVQRGCDNFCSYCVVPYVRGPEQSRPVEHILEEVKRLGEYAREITLLGQTVSSYRAVHDGSLVDLAELLYRVHQASPVSRIRFITSYPNDFNDGIFHAMAELDRVCPYLHIPAQHGSNRILSLMNRRYTVEEYLDLIERGRRIVPGLSLAGDFIVGFPTETEEDHESSLKLMRTIRYKNCFMFKYSVRPGTLAEKKFSDDISDDVKTLRHRQMLDLQNLISLEDNQSMIGQSVRILVEGISKKNRHQNEEIVQLVGRTVEDKIVVFDGKRELIGKNIEVRITSATALTLFADRVQG